METMAKAIGVVAGIAGILAFIYMIILGIQDDENASELLAAQNTVIAVLQEERDVGKELATAEAATTSLPGTSEAELEELLELRARATELANSASTAEANTVILSTRIAGISVESAADEAVNPEPPTITAEPPTIAATVKIEETDIFEGSVKGVEETRARLQLSEDQYVMGTADKFQDSLEQHLPPFAVFVVYGPMDENIMLPWGGWDQYRNPSSSFVESDLLRRIQQTKVNHPSDWMTRGINVYRCHGSLLNCTIDAVPTN